MTTPYRNFDVKSLILRDHLAIDRTILANERTYLAYIRTALAFFISGAGLLKFFDSGLILALGWIFIAGALIIALIGYRRYAKVRKTIRSARQEEDSLESSASENQQ
jgi:putative membrane protein